MACPELVYLDLRAVPYVPDHWARLECHHLPPHQASDKEGAGQVEFAGLDSSAARRLGHDHPGRYRLSLQP